MAAVGKQLQGSKNWRVGVRTKEWKYVCAPKNPDIPEELYHLAVDPDEWRNLAKTHRARAAQLKRQLFEIVSGTYYLEDDTSGIEMSEDEKAVMEERLKQLGYL